MSDTPENVISSIPPLDPGGGPPSDDTLPGMQLGDYVIEKAVAWGGMGIVYRAVHPLIGRRVAVKVLRPNFASDPEQVARFLKEAQAISSIKHRGIIDIIGFGKVPMPDGRQYMVMEFLDGETLEAVMQREGPMNLHRALTIVEELLDALSAAHKVGVVHRDLKPSNVYITLQSNGSRYVKLVDFGLARKASVEQLNRHSGKASLMAGTPEYLSPEQAKGLSATPRTDLYCLGVMLFEMLTGRLPFLDGSMIELLNAHLTRVPPRAATLVGGIPPVLDALIAQLLLKQPEARPSTAEIVRQQVQRMIRQLREDETHIGARPSGEKKLNPVTTPPRAVVGPPPADEKTRLMKDTTRGPPPVDERTAIVSETIRMPALTDAEVSRSQASGPSTQPDFAPKLQRWLWGAVAAGVAAIGASVAVYLWPAEPADQVLKVSVPGPPEEAVAPPLEPPDEALALEPERPPVAHVPDKPKPKPVKPQVAAPKADVPSGCENEDRTTMMSLAVEQGEKAYLAKYRTAVDRDRVNELNDFRTRSAGVKNVDDCAAVLHALERWRKKQGLPPELR